MPKSKKGSSVKAAANGAVYYGALQYPISRAVQAGDFVFTSAFGCCIPEHDDQVFTDQGLPLSTGKRRKTFSFADEVHAAFRILKDALALADCTLADVVDCQVWLKDGRDFAELNRIYVHYFTDTRPVRSVLQNHFVMEYRIEMKMIAYKPRP
jgi:2-iminobutanoate/2-iminopropanoate deaminase